MYSLDSIDIRLRKTALGSRIVREVAEHAQEAMFLINNHRPTMVAWNRNKGPEFTAAAFKSGFEEGALIPAEIGGVTLKALLRRMAAALMEAGSPALRQAIESNLNEVLRTAEDCNSLLELFDLIEEKDRAGASPAPNGKHHG